MVWRSQQPNHNFSSTLCVIFHPILREKLLSWDLKTVLSGMGFENKIFKIWRKEKPRKELRRIIMNSDDWSREELWDWQVLKLPKIVYYCNHQSCIRFLHCVWDKLAGKVRTWPEESNDVVCGHFQTCHVGFIKMLVLHLYKKICSYKIKILFFRYS